LSATSLPRVTPDLALPAVCRPDRSLSTFNFELSTSFSPSLTPFRPLPLRARKPRRINTYETPRKCCIQRTYRIAKTFKCNTYKKHGGWGVLWLTRNPMKDVILFHGAPVTAHETRHLASLARTPPIRPILFHGAPVTGHGTRQEHPFPDTRHSPLPTFLLGRGRQFQRSKNCPILRNFS